MPGTASSWFYSPPGPGPSGVMGPRPQGPSASGFAAWLIFLAVRFANPPANFDRLKAKKRFLALRSPVISAHSLWTHGEFFGIAAEALSRKVQASILPFFFRLVNTPHQKESPKTQGGCFNLLWGCCCSFSHGKFECSS